MADNRQIIIDDPLSACVYTPPRPYSRRPPNIRFPAAWRRPRCAVVAKIVLDYAIYAPSGWRVRRSRPACFTEGSFSNKTPLDSSLSLALPVSRTTCWMRVSELLSANMNSKRFACQSASGVSSLRARAQVGFEWML
ncbi:hypothetical protein EVAR_52877_1 [Eumeta japonica]|uniref:Uncharacterized protein n=1 Tax=Eumeta variegata TaxID=151549 RepID=A0A4C1YIX5_EUMVA|nr:hypothetical protein EVAR_52877_1 [Eumeta japonica]